MHGVICVSTRLYTKYSQEEFLQKRSNFKKKTAKNNNQTVSFSEGTVIDYMGKEYFVINKSQNDSLLCIPYNGDYRLDRVFTIKKNKSIKFITKLTNKEIIEILKKLSSNITIQCNGDMHSLILLKIKNKNR